MFNILMIDDSITMRKMVKMALKPLTVNVFEANNGIEGIELLNKEKINFVISDLNMPEMNGFDFIRYMRQNESLNTIPVAIMSTEKKQSAFDTAKELGVAEYIVKPFTMPQLQGIVKKYMV